MKNNAIEILTVTNSCADYPTCYSARTEGDIAMVALDAIKELELEVSEETLADLIHDLKKESLYWIDDYAFEVYDI